ncbi:hypothetical protein GCK32_020146 [Trichostrongylus colubriformis]|uniref:Biopterin-dependent aromatic amino acid hydroxylase family profile domain-containing protein n=1 Tax=Trichostrongylus colubriformis TaxID=6319 RepID=A0AAN8F522_TRICO
MLPSLLAPFCDTPPHLQIDQYLLYFYTIEFGLCYDGLGESVVTGTTSNHPIKYEVYRAGLLSSAGELQ